MKKNNNDIFFDKENAYDKAEKNEKLNGVEFWEKNIKYFKDSLKRAGVSKELIRQGNSITKNIIRGE